MRFSDLFLAVNNAATFTSDQELIRQHFTIRVNAADIRRERYNNRDHIVLTSYTLPDNVVMNGGLYSREEIEANYKSIEGTLAPLGHPKVNGKHVSASSAEGINQSH